jgi:3'-5' exoribonuclease
MVVPTRTGDTKRGTIALWCKLQDRTGSMEAVYWDYPGGTFSGIFNVTGEVSEYQGRLQVKIQSIGPRVSTSDAEFEKCSLYLIEDMWGKLITHVDSIEHHDIKTVAEDILYRGEFEAAFKLSPAATFMHHAFKGGLLEHTLQMCDMTSLLFTLPFFRDALNRDLCLFGVLFHDFGKIFEYDPGPGFKKTLQGTLVPHIPMTGSIIYESCNKYGVVEIIRDHLMHVVLAHHGEASKGSPVDMVIPESAFVHYIDNLHGDVFGMIQKRSEAAGDFFKVFGKHFLTKSFDDTLKSL